jgi:flagellum-specific peptidoglycan hydrolase FlgJ
MDEVPVSLALAQAAKETGWGLQDLLKKEMHFLVNGLGQVKV